MSKENLPRIVRENIFTKIVKWFKKIINKKVKNNVDFPQNNIINNTTKEDFISNIKVEENIKMKQKKLKDNRINISELSDKELKQMIELYKSQIKHKKTELKKYRKMIFNNS